MPMTHLQGSSSGREASELQRVAMEMMPEVAAVRPESVQRVTVGERGRGDAGVDEAAATGGGAAAAVRERLPGAARHVLCGAGESEGADGEVGE